MTADRLAADPAPADTFGGAVGLLKALANPLRLRVIVELGNGPRCVHELLDAVRQEGREVSQPLMSQHLKVMREAGLVTTTRRAQEIAYELADSHVRSIALDAIQHAAEISGVHPDAAPGAA